MKKKKKSKQVFKRLCGVKIEIVHIYRAIKLHYRMGVNYDIIAIM